MRETWVQSLDQEDPLQKGMATHSGILGEFHGQSCLAGRSPWSHKATTEHLALTLFMAH